MLKIQKINSSMTKFRPTGDKASMGWQELALGLVPPFDFCILPVFSIPVLSIRLSLWPGSCSPFTHTDSKYSPWVPSSACYWPSKAFLSTAFITEGYLKLMKNSLNNLMKPVWLSQSCWFEVILYLMRPHVWWEHKKNTLGEKTMCQRGSDTLAPEHFTGHAPRDTSQSLGQAVL